MCFYTFFIFSYMQINASRVSPSLHIFIFFNHGTDPSWIWRINCLGSGDSVVFLKLLRHLVTISTDFITTLSRIRSPLRFLFFSITSLWWKRYLLSLKTEGNFCSENDIYQHLVHVPCYLYAYKKTHYACSALFGLLALCSFRPGTHLNQTPHF